jgi:hypothetical protein
MDLDHPNASEALDWSNSLKTLDLTVYSKQNTIRQIKHTLTHNQGPTHHHQARWMVQIERKELNQVNQTGSCEPVRFTAYINTTPVFSSLPSLVSLSRLNLREKLSLLASWSSSSTSGFLEKNKNTDEDSGDG